MISGDIDFAETVHDLVHTGGYKVILIHNKQARPELRRNASKALLWTDVVGGTTNGRKTGTSREKAKNSTGKKQFGEGCGQNERKAKGKAKAWTCAGCSRKFGTPEARDMHLAATGHAIQWTCGDCGKVFRRKEELQQHEKDVKHNLIACDECNASFVSLHLLAQHLDVTDHASYLVWPCPICKDEPWSNLKDLLDHLRLDHI